MFCFIAVLRCGSSYSHQSSVRTTVVVRFLVSDYSTAGAGDNRLFGHSAKTVPFCAPFLPSRLHQTLFKRQRATLGEPCGAISSQLFTPGAITQGCCNTIGYRGLLVREACKYCTSCSHPVTFRECRKLSGIEDFMPAPKRRACPVEPFGAAPASTNERSIGANSLFLVQCRQLHTSPAERLRLSTVGSQNSKKNPSVGSTSDPSASIPDNKAISEMSSREQSTEDPKKISRDEWRKRLDRETFNVCRLKGTERPGSGKYLNHSEKGTYVCVCCRANLFRSEDKFNHCGWPSFRQAMGTKLDGSDDSTNVKREYDGSHGMVRTEVLCRKCDSHLGHVFDDGPEPFGTRFCINSLSLDFVKDQ